MKFAAYRIYIYIWLWSYIGAGRAAYMAALCDDELRGSVQVLVQERPIIAADDDLDSSGAREHHLSIQRACAPDRQL